MNSTAFTKDHTYARQYQVREKHSPAADCHVALEPKQNPQFVPSVSDHHIAPDAQYLQSQNMCNTLQHIIFDHNYCQIPHPPLIFNISPMDNCSILAKYITLPVRSSFRSPVCKSSDIQIAETSLSPNILNDEQSLQFRTHTPLESNHMNNVAPISSHISAEPKHSMETQLQHQHNIGDMSTHIKLDHPYSQSFIPQSIIILW